MAVLPAYAGMIPERYNLATLEDCAPRVCGDDPPPRASDLRYGRCSPRMRG